MTKNIVFIGAGNLATQLSQALKRSGYNILQIYSKTENSAKNLAVKLDSNYTIFASEINTSADIYFIAVKDSVIHEVLKKVDLSNKLIVHCSGSMPISVLEEYSPNIGVFYPLQTFSKNRKISFEDIPVFIEANSTKNENILLEIAGEISNEITVLDSDKRKTLHISAVFACNFVNHFYTISAEILKNKQIPFQVLQPLIMETARKVQEMEPQDAQTGPAVRFDENIISTHLHELKGVKNYAELYNSISKSIFEHHQKIK